MKKYSILSLLLILSLSGCSSKNITNNVETIKEETTISVNNTEITTKNEDINTEITPKNVVSETEVTTLITESTETEVLSTMSTETNNDIIVIESTETDAIKPADIINLQGDNTVSTVNEQEELLVGDRPDKNISSEKTVYLTFDDGPSIYTDTILDILAENDIKATFFVVANNFEGKEEQLKRIVDEGHVLGIHTSTHDYDLIYESTANYIVDFENCYKDIYDITGYKPWAFRFPGGSNNNFSNNKVPEIADILNQRGFEYFDWTCSLEDSTSKSNYEYCMSQFYNSCQSKYEIILMHDSKEMSTLCLPEIIDYCKQNGYNFDTVENADYHFDLG